jgi:hypothetical protein
MTDPRTASELQDRVLELETRLDEMQVKLASLASTALLLLDEEMRSMVIASVREA